MKYMLIFTASGVVATEYDEGNMEMYVLEGTPVMVFNDEEDLVKLDIDYQWA